MNFHRLFQFATVTLILLACSALPSAEEPLKAPFHVLYNNDLTNVTTCTSPWHKKGESFRPEMLEASVDEVAGAGVEVHLLAPGLCEVPWWQSTVLPLAKHAAWIKETYGLQPDGF